MSIQAPTWLFAPAVFTRYEDVSEMYFEWLNCTGKWYLGNPGSTINQLLSAGEYILTIDICIIYQTGHFLYRYIYTEQSLKVALKELNKRYHAAYNRAEICYTLEEAVAEYTLDINLRHLSNNLHALYNVIYPHMKLTSPRMMKRHTDAIRFLEDKIEKITLGN